MAHSRVTGISYGLAHRDKQLTPGQLLSTSTIFDNDTVRWAFYLDSGTDLDDTGSPVLDGYVLRPSLTHVAVWCPWCQRSHVHGSGGQWRIINEGITSADGARAAHCITSASPFRKDGYVIRTIDVASHREIGSWRSRCAVCDLRIRKAKDQPFHVACETEYWSRFEFFGDLDR